MNILSRLDRTRLAVVCILICAGYAVAGWWPFEFVAGNGVEWLSPGPGISLARHALLRGERAFDLSAAGGVTFELHLEPEEEPSRNLGSFLSLYDGRFPEILIIAQWRTGFLVRSVVPNSSGGRGRREMGGSAQLYKGARRVLAVTSGADGTRLYADGALVRAYPGWILPPDSLRGELCLGTGAAGVTGWRGKLFGVAFFARALTAQEITGHTLLWKQYRGKELASDPSIAGLYLFSEGRGRTVHDSSPAGRPLTIPEVYRAPAKEILMLPWDDWSTGVSHVEDIVVNLAGFVPFGFFYYLYRDRARPGRRLLNALHAVVFSACISLVIELVQVFLPSRSSSMTDVLCNATGGLLGALAATIRPPESET